MDVGAVRALHELEEGLLRHVFGFGRAIAKHFSEPGHQIAGMHPIERVDVAVAALPVRAGAGRVPQFSHAVVRPVLA